MRRTLAPAAIAASTILALGSTALSAHAAPSTGTALDRATGVASYIVVLADNAPSGRIASAHDARLGVDVGHVYSAALNGYSARMTSTAADLVADDPAVDWVQEDTAVTTTAQTTPTGINRSEADLSPTARVNGVDERVNVDVAVIDTGVDLTHPEINVYSAGAKNCSTGAVNANDLNGHGTHVSGTIGAIDNGAGVVGMAPGARIWPVKVLTDAGSGLNSDVICGIDYVTAHADEIEVANMSLGGAGTDDGNCGNSNNDAMHRSICRSVAAGITYAVAAGNDSEDAANSTPAAYDEVITVSALADFNGQPGAGAPSTCRTDVDDTFASFSNFGADVDIIAPGVCINSTWMLGGYNTISGTSMAAPHVAGGAALYMSNNPAATPVQVKAALRSAGSTNWNSSDDPDAIKEPLLNASTF